MLRRLPPFRPISASIMERFAQVRGPSVRAISTTNLQSLWSSSFQKRLYTSGGNSILTDTQSHRSSFRMHTGSYRQGKPLYNVTTERAFFQHIQKIVRSLADGQKAGSATETKVINGDDAGSSSSYDSPKAETMTSMGSDFLQLLFKSSEQTRQKKDNVVKVRGDDTTPKNGGAMMRGNGNPSPSKPIDGNDKETRERPRPYEGSGKDPKESEWLVNPDLKSHIRACLTDIEFETPELAQRDTGFSLCTLGTGAGTASRLRNNSATLIKTGGDSYLVDAGEGLQRQLLVSRMNFRSIRKILITHMHGDHVFGLPGMLLAMQVASVTALKTRKLEIYGPVGIYNYISSAIALSGTELQKLSVDVYELHGGTQRSLRYSANRKSFPDFSSRGLVRKVLPQNKDGTWTISEPLEITTPELAEEHSSTPRGVSIKAAEIHHIPQLQCFGYTVEEPLTQPRHINAELALSLGVPPGESFKRLKSGFPVMHKDGIRLIQPEEVLLEERPRARKVTVLGDCCMVPPAMERLAHDSDVLIHEATLTPEDSGKKVVTSGHSTAAQAAAFANKVRAKVLMLNHLGRRRDQYVGMRECIREAELHVPSATKVQVCFDHLELLIPRNGFVFE